MRDGVLTAARWALRIVLGLNWLSLALFVGLLGLSLVAPHAMTGRLVAKYGAGVDAAGVVAALRALMLCGLVAFAIVRVLARRLLAMIATVEQGDPFTRDNGRRLTVIGWGLVAWQLLDLVLGGMVAWFERLGVDHAGWTPGLTGWVVTLMVFVLARVFAVGAAMRDDLEGTV